MGKISQVKVNCFSKKMFILEKLIMDIIYIKYTILF